MDVVCEYSFTPEPFFDNFHDLWFIVFVFLWHDRLERLSKPEKRVECYFLSVSTSLKSSAMGNVRGDPFHSVSLRAWSNNHDPMNDRNGVWSGKTKSSKWRESPATINTIKKIHQQWTHQLKKSTTTTNTIINKRHNNKQVKQNAITMCSNKKN